MYRIVPAGVAVPRGIDDLQGIVRWAAETGTALVPRGSGSGMPGNSVGRGVLAEDGAVRRIRRGGGPGRFGLDERQRALARERFPRTRKNSGGYALDRFAESGDELDLFVGSEGTLGIVTAVQWRLEPAPPDVGGAGPGVSRPGQHAGPVPLSLV